MIKLEHIIPLILLNPWSKQTQILLSPSHENKFQLFLYDIWKYAYSDISKIECVKCLHGRVWPFGNLNN